MDSWFKSYEDFKISTKVGACCQPLSMQQNLPKSAKIYPKTISLRNFEMPPKIEILVCFKKKKSTCRGSTRVYFHRLDFQYNSFLYFFFIFRYRPLNVNFSIPPCKKWFFSQCSTPLVGMRFWGHVPNSLRNKNMERHIPYLL
jgi:hypothetical protein